MQAGVVEEINIAPDSAPDPIAHEHVRALAGRGLEGDRYQADAPGGRQGEDLTLVAAEALEGLLADTGIELPPRLTRRNVVTRGIDLNALVGKRFRVGEVDCVGVELCEPCRGLQARTQPGVLRGLAHRGGLRANILTDGELRVGDVVASVD